MRYFVLFLLFSINSFAQTGGKIEGNLLTNNLSAPLAQIGLRLFTSSTIVANGITDKKGNFQFDNVPEGNYTLKVNTSPSYLIKNVFVRDGLITPIYPSWESRGQIYEPLPISVIEKKGAKLVPTENAKQ